MANPYRGLFAVPGARTFVAAGFVGRMSMSMVGIGVVLLVSAVTGSYGIAGAVSATFALAYAGGAPVNGRLADRFGQQSVLVPLVLTNSAAFTVLVLLAQLGAPTWTLFPAAAAAGMTTPSMGAWVRARWSHALRDDQPRLHTAFAFESVVDETVFVTGPMLVTALATGVHPTAGVAASASFTLTGGLLLAAQHRTQPPSRRAPGVGSGEVPARGGSALAIPGVIVIALTFLMMGVVFASVDVSGVAFAEEAGHKPLAGVLLGAYALGSGVTALWYGARIWRMTLRRRFMIGVAVFAAGMVPLPLIPDLYVMMAVIFLSGLAVSPTIIPGYGLVERLVPRHQLTEGLATVSTSVGVGLAIGSSLAGRVVDAFGARAAFLVPLGGGLVAAVVGIAGTCWIGERESSS